MDKYACDDLKVIYAFINMEDNNYMENILAEFGNARNLCLASA